MVVIKKVEAVVLKAKQFARNFLDINWNDHLLSEMNNINAKRHGFNEYNKER